MIYNRLRITEKIVISKEAITIALNDVAITESELKFHWPAPGPRPSDDAGIASVR